MLEVKYNEKRKSLESQYDIFKNGENMIKKDEKDNIIASINIINTNDETYPMGAFLTINCDNENYKKLKNKPDKLKKLNDSLSKYNENIQILLNDFYLEEKLND